MASLWTFVAASLDGDGLLAGGVLSFDCPFAWALLVEGFKASRRPVASEKGLDKVQKSICTQTDAKLGKFPALQKHIIFQWLSKKF